VRIASKINAALLGAFACGTLASYGVLQSAIQPKFNDIERSMALVNHKRVTDAFEAATDKLQTATQDYAFWDQTYDFMNGEKADDFIASNLTPEFKAVENLGLNTLVFQGPDGNVLWGAAYDLETKEPIEGMVKEIAHFSRSHPFIGDTATLTKRGLIQTSKGLVLVAIAPVLKGDQSGPARGRVISAKALDIETVKQLTGVDFSLEPLPDLVVHSDLPAATDLTTLDQRIVTTSVVNSVIGRPLAYLKVNSSRDVSDAGTAAIKSALVMMVLAGLFAIGILWLFLSRVFVSRIVDLKSHFATAGVSGKIAPVAIDLRSDEIGDLAQSFNSMADQVNHLRDALADSAYMTGLSEWAAGTLHNVRNGLAPVTVTAWQVEQLFDAAWVKNIETAAAEHADAATPADRRLKLNAFLVGSASRFVDAAKQTSSLTGKINGASSAVLDMVAEFERYAHRKTELEAVDLRPLIKATAAATLEGRGKDIELVLPAATATVYGNGVILRQIISNIFVNAVEAIEGANTIEGQRRRGRIEVSIAPRPDAAGFTRLAISDNGEGLSIESLTAIFRRGVSTRHQRTGGLGLHWCANAVKVLGGTICAESAGAGLGATIVINLPDFTQDKQEAA
jgi:signal transduction histidine kinase